MPQDSEYEEMLIGKIRELEIEFRKQCEPYLQELYKIRAMRAPEPIIIDKRFADCISQVLKPGGDS